MQWERSPGNLAVMDHNGLKLLCTFDPDGTPFLVLAPDVQPATREVN